MALASALQVNVAAFPLNVEPGVSIRMSANPLIGGVWMPNAYTYAAFKTQPLDYTYTAYGAGTAGLMQTPTPCISWSLYDVCPAALCSSPGRRALTHWGTVSMLDRRGPYDI